MSEAVVCRIGGHDWTLNRLAGRIIVRAEDHEEELDIFVDEEAHAINVRDTGDVDQVLRDACRGIEEAMELEEGAAVSAPDWGDDIEPTGLGPANVPVLPDDPEGGD